MVAWAFIQSVPFLSAWQAVALACSSARRVMRPFEMCNLVAHVDLFASLAFKVLQTQKGQTSAWPSQLLYAHRASTSVVAAS
jgi:hypothetical protein